MKKVLWIGLIVALALLLVGGVGFAYAMVRGINQPVVVAYTGPQAGGGVVQQYSYGPGGMMGGYGYGPGGMMGGQGYGYGPGGMMGGQGSGYGPGGMMGGRGGEGYGPGGMMGGYGPGSMMRGYGRGFAQGYGIMHDYMISAFAEAVGLTVEQVDTRLAGGETMKEIAIAQGTTADKIPDLVAQVHKAALDKAVADGVITQAQADRMLERMQNYSGEGFGPGFGAGNCPMWDGDEVQP